MLFFVFTFISIIIVVIIPERYFPLFIRGGLFICVVIITITISFISHIICTRAHDAEADHIIDREPNWRCWGDAAG